MGCDIHIFVEVFKDKKWIQIDPLVHSIEFERKENKKDLPFIHELDPSEISEYSSAYTLRPRPILTVPWQKQIYSGRNYELFGILAGVRSFFIEPLIPPRGLPSDMSDTLQDIADHYYEHTGHWYTLEELITKKKYPRSVSSFFSHKNKKSVLNKLKQRAKKHKVNFKQIRIVFWFDS